MATEPKPKQTSDQTRDKVAHELLETERSYVISLNTLVQLYIKPLKTNNLISQKDIEFIFSNIEHILIINRELLDSLEKRMQIWDTNPTLGDVMIKLIPWLRLYNKYCENYHNASARVYKLAEKSSAFSQFLDDTKKQTQLLDLSSLLIMPIQRIPRYKLLLRELCKHTDPEHPDYQPLKQALEKVNEVAQNVNESVRRKQNFDDLIELKKKMIGSAVPKNLVSKNRVFIYEGTLTKLCRKIPKKRHVFLFSDLLLYGEEAPIGNVFRIHRSIQLRKAKISPVEDTETRKNAFAIFSNQKSFYLWAETAEEKKIWEDKFEESKKILKLTHFVSSELASEQSTRHSVSKHATQWLGGLGLGLGENNTENEINILPQQNGEGGGGGEEGSNSVEFDAPIWVTDGEAGNCMLCSIKFTTLRRRHHCRKCGKVVCGKCSENKFQLPVGKSRVCDDCWEDLSGVMTKRKSMRMSGKFEGSFIGGSSISPPSSSSSSTSSNASGRRFTLSLPDSGDKNDVSKSTVSPRVFSVLPSIPGWNSKKDEDDSPVAGTSDDFNNNNNEKKGLMNYGFSLSKKYMGGSNSNNNDKPSSKSVIIVRRDVDEEFGTGRKTDNFKSEKKDLTNEKKLDVVESKSEENFDHHEKQKEIIKQNSIEDLNTSTVEEDLSTNNNNNSERFAMRKTRRELLKQKIPNKPLPAAPAPDPDPIAVERQPDHKHDHKRHHHHATTSHAGPSDMSDNAKFAVKKTRKNNSRRKSLDYAMLIKHKPLPPLPPISMDDQLHTAQPSKPIHVGSSSLPPPPPPSKPKPQYHDDGSVVSSKHSSKRSSSSKHSSKSSSKSSSKHSKSSKSSKSSKPPSEPLPSTPVSSFSASLQSPPKKKRTSHSSLRHTAKSEKNKSASDELDIPPDRPPPKPPTLD